MNYQMLFSKPIKGKIRDLNFSLFDVIHVHISNICGPHRYYTSLSMHRLNGQVNVTNLDQVGVRYDFEYQVVHVHI